MGTTLTHSNYESDTDALVRDLESLIGRQPLLVRVLSWTPAIGRSVSRLPTALKVVVGAVFVIATLSIFVPHGVQTAVAESRALIKVAGSNDRIPLSRDAAADMKAILASTADSTAMSSGGVESGVHLRIMPPVAGPRKCSANSNCS